MDKQLRDLLDRQAAWQRARADRPWAEKLREAVALRRAIEKLRKRPDRPADAGHPAVDGANALLK